MRPLFPASRRPSASDAARQFEAEFDQLYHQRFPSLFRYLDRNLGDAALAADLVQEAFIRLFDRGEMPDEPVAWLVTVATNLLRDDRRRTSRRLTLLARAGDDAPHTSAAPDPATAADRSERRQQVRVALERLALRDREALLLRHSGYSYREIALALGITETSVGTILLRAGTSFRKAYQELHGDPD